VSEPALKDKVEELIRDHRVVLFMKGEPQAPRCGFSMRVVGVLDSLGVEYAALDVLPALEPLRQVTGEISDWRTFPQLYVNGELVGGADIVEEMYESGELADLLEVEQPAEAIGVQWLWGRAGRIPDRNAPGSPPRNQARRPGTSEDQSNCDGGHHG
jgi:monothiol glutaredoxin